MAINILPRLRDENFGTCLVKRYLATDTAGRAYYSGARISSRSAEAGTGRKSPTSSPPRTCSP